MVLNRVAVGEILPELARRSFRAKLSGMKKEDRAAAIVAAIIIGPPLLFFIFYLFLMLSWGLG